MEKSVYFVTESVRCGEMPFFLVFYRARGHRGGDSIMLCSQKNHRRLMHARRIFYNPKLYGRTFCRNSDANGMAMLKAILKLRYDFDFDHAPAGAVLAL